MLKLVSFVDWNSYKFFTGIFLYDDDEGKERKIQKHCSKQILKNYELCWLIITGC